MINQAKAVKLIKIYQYVCDKYEEELQYHCKDLPIIIDPNLQTKKL